MRAKANLTAERALEISQAMETVEKGAKDFKEEHQDSKRQETETAAIKVVRKPVPNRARPSRREEGCTRCAGNGHNSWNCPYRGTQCHKCKRVGHLARACRSSGSDYASSDRAPGTRVQVGLHRCPEGH